MLSKIVEIYNYTPTNQNHQGVYLFKDFGGTSVLASSILPTAPPPNTCTFCVALEFLTENFVETSAIHRMVTVFFLMHSR